MPEEEEEEEAGATGAGNFQCCGPAQLRRERVSKLFNISDNLTFFVIKIGSPWRESGK